MNIDSNKTYLFHFDKGITGDVEFFLENSEKQNWFISENTIGKKKLTISSKEKNNDLVELLFRSFQLSPCKTETQEEKDWIQNWIDSLKPFPFLDRFWINPFAQKDLIQSDTHLSKSDFEKIIEIKIEPGTVFGSGEHATTIMAANAIKKYLRKNDSFLDIGTGSGILSIISSHLGASKISALEHEEKAIKFANKNFELNNVTCSLYKSDLLDALFFNKDCLKSYDLIASNVISREQLRLLDDMRLIEILKTGGYLILTGTEKQQEYFILESLKHKFSIVEKIEKNDWICFVCQKN